MLLHSWLTVIWTSVGAAAFVPNDSDLEATTYSISQPNGTYVFGYDNVRDSKGNQHFRFEEKLTNGTIVGEYDLTHYSRSTVVKVTYVALMKEDSGLMCKFVDLNKI